MKFEYVVFSGGGCRCIWQAGFWHVVQPALGLTPTIVSAVSAGATMAAMIFSENSQKGLEYFLKITQSNKKNIYPKHLFSRKRVFPQYRLYKRFLLETMDQKALSALQNGPDIRVWIARPPAYLGPFSATFFGFFLYNLEKYISGRVHPVFGKKVGFTPHLVPVKSCKTPENLIRLLLASSCTPPFVPIMTLNNAVALDGGLVDNVPVDFLYPGEPEKPTLVLLTRTYPKKQIPRKAHRTYIQPSRKIPVKRWDYTNPEGVRKTFELGKTDGERFLKK